MKIPKYNEAALLRQERTKKDQEWACAVKSRDNWCCAICGSKYVPNAHHIISRERLNYRWDLHNGITLCVQHHKFSRFISAHNQPMAFFLWLKKYRVFQYEYAVEHVQEMLLGDIVI